MNIIKELIFDLDGTLWSSSAACAESWNRVVRRNGIDFREVTEADVDAVTGKPHSDCIRAVYASLPDEQIELLVEETKTEDVKVIGELGGRLYEGVEQGLRRLAERYPLYIVSNCQSGYIEMFLERNQFGSLFQDIECWGNTGKPKGENIATLIRRNGLAAPVYIGDTDGDRQGARHCAIPFVQVTYGFGEPLPDETQAGSFSELVQLFLNGGV